MTRPIEILNVTDTGIEIALKAELYNNPAFTPPKNFRVTDGVWSVNIRGEWLDLVKDNRAKNPPR